jgi:acyl-CoA thioester hydrolase
MHTTTPPLPKELESTTTIRFQDCDPYGHLNNARYIDYFMNARVDHVAAAYNFHIFDRMSTDNEAWIVTHTQIRYVWPARFNEQVLIRTRLLDVSERVLLLEAQMVSADGTRLLALAWIEFMIVDAATGRPKRHSPELMAFFESVRVDGGYDPQGFNEHVAEVKRQLRRGVISDLAVQPEPLAASQPGNGSA